MLTPAIVGVMFGLSVALPFGPVSLMCIQRTLADGLRSGLVAGAGAVTAQGIFAPAALYGRDLVAAELALWRGPIREFSALLLIALGLRMLLRRNKQSATAAPACAQAAYGSTLALALSTPITVLPYLGVASGTAAAASGARVEPRRASDELLQLGKSTGTSTSATIRAISGGNVTIRRPISRVVTRPFA